MHCRVWVTKEHLESSKHLTKLCKSTTAQACTLQESSSDGHLLTLTRIGVMEEKMKESLVVETELIEDSKVTADRVTALENLVVKAIGDMCAMSERWDRAEKLVAELEKRVTAVEPREYPSSWNDGAQAGRWRNPSKWVPFEPATSKKARWPPSSSSTW